MEIHDTMMFTVQQNHDSRRYTLEDISMYPLATRNSSKSRVFMLFGQRPTYPQYIAPRSRFLSTSTLISLTRVFVFAQSDYFCNRYSVVGYRIVSAPHKNHRTAERRRARHFLVSLFLFVRTKKEREASEPTQPNPTIEIHGTLSFHSITSSS